MNSPSNSDPRPGPCPVCASAGIAVLPVRYAANSRTLRRDIGWWDSSDDSRRHNGHSRPDGGPNQDQEDR